MPLSSVNKVYNKSYQSQAINYKTYLETLGYTAHTCQTRYLYLNQFFSWLEHIQIQELKAITPKNIADYQTYIVTP